MFPLYNHVLFVVSMFCKFLTMMTLLLNCMVVLALLLNFVCRFLYVVKFFFLMEKCNGKLVVGYTNVVVARR
jgi:hypothetical protein